MRPFYNKLLLKCNTEGDSECFKRKKLYVYTNFKDELKMCHDPDLRSLDQGQFIKFRFILKRRVWV